MRVPNNYYQSLPLDTNCESCGEYRSCNVFFTDPDPETGYRGETTLCADCYEEEE